jgi:C4-dicarboxylate-specific signal transduction histidine kinase
VGAEQATALRELQELAKNIDHIKEIVAMQQSYARVAGVIEKLSVTDLMEDALRMHSAALARHRVRIVKHFDGAPEIHVDKHKVIQILINLVSNAKYALSDANVKDKVLTLEVHRADNGVRVVVQDNGVGVPAENLTRIFSHGFTTRAQGHGFGLHAGALAAHEMGGSLRVHSDGPGHGAAFTLELPLQPPASRDESAAPETTRPSLAQPSRPVLSEVAVNA